MQVTDCQCTEPGWCERHHCEKSRYLFELCRRRQDFFRRWEKNQGPGQRERRTRTLEPQDACRHLEQLIAEKLCSGCRGQVRVKIFRCQIHGECSLGRQLDDTACCAVCQDYVAASQ
jgi:hypothetical protein